MSDSPTGTTGRRSTRLLRCPACGAPTADDPVLAHAPPVCDPVVRSSALLAEGWTVLGTGQPPVSLGAWPEVTESPMVGQVLGGLGPRSEVAMRAWRGRGGAVPAVEVAAAARVLEARDGLDPVAAVQRAVAMDVDALRYLCKLQELPLVVPGCGHRLVFRDGVLDGRHAGRDCGCPDVVHHWEQGPLPQLAFDVVTGTPPRYESVIDPAPTLTTLRHLLAVVAYARLVSAAAAAGLGWFATRLGVSILPAEEPPWLGWYGRFPAVAVGLRPDWWWRVGRFGSPCIDGRLVLDSTLGGRDGQQVLLTSDLGEIDDAALDAGTWEPGTVVAPLP